MEQPLVSIIIGCYNLAHLLRKGMQSVMRQTYKNIEIWLVNDGSTDSTGAICDELASNDTRIHVIHKDNGGLATARNAGLKASKGEYIYFCDADDVLELDLIEKMVHLAENYRTDMVIFSMDIHEGFSGTKDDIRFDDLLVTSNEELKKIFCDKIFFSKHGNGFVWNKFYTRSFLQRANARFGIERIQQDEPFNLRLYPHVERLLLTSYKGYNYYLSPSTSTGARFVEKKYEAVTSVYEALTSFQDTWLGEHERFKNSAEMRYLSSLHNVIFYNFSHKVCPWPKSQIYMKLQEFSETENIVNIYEKHKTKLDFKSSIMWSLFVEQKFSTLLLVTEIFDKIRAAKRIFLRK